MNDINQLKDNPDLMFFGRVNASISHELKNILAIISETAGLMTDLMEMAGRGKAVDPETLMGCGRDIIEEIDRGFATIKQMNRFSHSVDEVLADIDLFGLLELVSGLTGYLSTTGDVRIGRSSTEPCLIRTCPFRLQYVVYTVLTQMFRILGPHATVNVAVMAATDRPVEISFASADAPVKEEALSLEGVEAIAASIDATLASGSDARSVRLVLPQAI